MTHDYKCNGTIDLFAAMNLATGQVLTGLNKGHTGSDVLRFFKQIDATVPRGLGVHVVLDNLSAHSTPEINKWLAHRDRRRWHLHFTPTSSSWLNLIERWFKELTDRRLRRGTFTSVDELSQAITTCKMCTEDQSPTTALLVEVPVPTMLVAEQAGARPTRRGWSTIAAVGYARVRLDPADVRTAVKELHALDVDSANIHLDRGMARQRDTPTLQESHRKSPAGRQPGNGEPRPIGAQLGRTDSCGWAARTTAGSAHRGSYLPGGQVR